MYDASRDQHDEPSILKRIKRQHRILLESARAQQQQLEELEQLILSYEEPCYSPPRPKQTRVFSSTSLYIESPEPEQSRVSPSKTTQSELEPIEGLREISVIVEEPGQEPRKAVILAKPNDDEKTLLKRYYKLQRKPWPASRIVCKTVKYIIISATAFAFGFYVYILVERIVTNLFDMDFKSQEFICIAVVSSVCVLLSMCCIALWLCRCRRDIGKHKEERAERQIQMNKYHNEKKVTSQQKSEIQISSSLKAGPKRPEGYGVQTEESIRQQGSDALEGETIAEFEKRMKRPTSRNSSNEPVPKNHKSETISEKAMSQESLQRNDSKVNIFNMANSHLTPANEEMDLNPALSGSINLETI